MTLTTTRSPEAILDDVRAFAATEIAPRAREFDVSGELPRPFIDQLAAQGYLAASFPEQYGGLGLNPVEYGLFTEAIGKACSNVRALITVQTSLIGESLLRYGTPEQKQTWLPRIARGEKLGAFALSEPNVGSNAKGVETVYRKEGSLFVLNGRKRWISFAGIADFFLVMAREESSDRVSAFLIERGWGGVKTTPMQGLLANRASHVAEIDLHNVLVPEENLLGSVGGGFIYVTSTALDHGRYSIAWGSLAIAEAALEAMVTYSRTRSQFGEKLHQFQLIKGIIGDAITQIHAARALCLRAGELRAQNHPDAVIETSMAKYFASKIAMEIATQAVQVHGGNGITNEYPVERLFREAKVMEIIEGTSQLQQGVIADFGLHRYYVKP